MTALHPLLDQLFAIPVDERRVIVYAPLKRIGFIANRAMVDCIVDHCNGVHGGDRCSEPSSLLARLVFFHPEDSTFFKPPAGWPWGYDTIVLFLTNQCNLRCSYCYASSGSYPTKRMPWSIAKVAIDRVADNVISQGLQELTLGFHGGGEPSLSFDGLPAVQNHQRPTINGGKASPRVERSLRALDRADFSYGIRMTVTDFSVDC